jgi:hypothetical protein
MTLLAGAAAACLLLTTLTAAPAAAAVAMPHGKTFVGVTTIRSEDGKVLPARSYRLANGGTETMVDSAAFQALASLASSDPCGYGCDGKDPQTYQVLGLNGHTYLCANDAFSPRTLNNGYATVELRYSPRCRTAWTRGCCYTNFAGFGYYANGSYRNSVYATGRNSGSRVWTAMLNDADLLYTACVDTQLGGSPQWQCTGLY